MRLSRSLSVAFALASVAFAPQAFAGEGDKPAVKPPNWGVADIILRSTPIPEGWSVVSDETATAPAKEMEAAVKAIIATEGIDELYTELDVVTVKKGEGAPASLLLVAIDEDPKGLTGAVQALAKEKSWTYRELTTPMRFILAAGPEEARTAAVQVQETSAVEALTRRAFQTLEQAGRSMSPDGKRTGMERAAGFARSAIALDGRAAMPHLVLALLAAGEAEQDKAKWAVAAEEFRKAFAEDATVKPDGMMAMQALSQFGLALLMQKTPEGNAEAKKVLLKALDYEKFDERGALKGNIRYNLACALSLLGEKADAIKQLEASLVAMKASMPQADFEEFVRDHIPKDTDMDPIRNEPEFAEAIKRATGGGTPSGV